LVSAAGRERERERERVGKKQGEIGRESARESERERETEWGGHLIEGGLDVGERLHPAPYTLHPTPSTLTPTPCAIHPQPHQIEAGLDVAERCDHVARRQREKKRGGDTWCAM